MTTQPKTQRLPQRLPQRQPQAQPYGSGAASVARINDALRSGSIKTLPPGAGSMAGDPHLLRDGVPVLRLVGSKHQRSATEPVPFVAEAPRSQADLALRAKTWAALGLWCLGCLAGAAYWVWG